MLPTPDQVYYETDWLKKAILISVFHHWNCMEHSGPRPFGWTIRKTADALQISRGYVCESLQLAREYQGKDIGNMSRMGALECLKKSNS